MPSTIEAVHRAYQVRGLAVLAVNLGERADTVATWARERKLTMPVVLDPRGSIARSYAISSTPTVYLVDRDGKFVGKAIGTRPWTSDQGRSLLQALLGS